MQPAPFLFPSSILLRTLFLYYLTHETPDNFLCFFYFGSERDATFDVSEAIVEDIIVNYVPISLQTRFLIGQRHFTLVK